LRVFYGDGTPTSGLWDGLGKVFRGPYDLGLGGTQYNALGVSVRVFGRVEISLGNGGVYDIDAVSFVVKLTVELVVQSLGLLVLFGQFWYP